jgi:hypothetical protein
MHMSLEEKTLGYWNLSTAYQGKPSQTPNITTEGAIKACNTLAEQINPARPLAKRIFLIKDSIIVGAPKSKRSKTPVAVPSNIVQLAR